MTPQKISVAILAYNHAAYVQECLDSYLDTHYPDLELIILDNGSTDDTFEVITALQAQEKYKNVKATRIFPGLGVNAGFNHVLHQATGDLVCMTSADDYTFPDRFQKQMAFFDANPGLKACYAMPSFFEDKEEGRVFWDSPLLASYRETVRVIKANGLEFARNYYTDQAPFYMIGIFCLQASLFDRQFVMDFGGFDEAELADDIIFNFRLFRALQTIDQVAFMEEPLIGYRQHSTQAHKDFRRQSRLVAEALDKYAPPAIRNKLLADIYFFQVMVGFSVYKLDYFALTTSYMIKSMRHEFNIERVARYFYLLGRATILVMLGPVLVRKIKTIIRRN